MSSSVLSISDLRQWLDGRSLRRVFLITGPNRRFLDRLRPEFDGLDVTVFDGAQVHVPASVVAAARSALDEAEADVIVTLGGGSATGLGKALRLEVERPFVAIATTYAGSEMTRIYGVLRGAEKQTGRDDRVRPDAVVHDVALTRGMPVKLTVTSLMNALAHPVSALSTGRLSEDQESAALRAVGALVDALETLTLKPNSVDARARALKGAAQTGAVLDEGTLGEHHRVAHFFGGRLNAEHSGLHAVLLAHTIAQLSRRHPELGGRLRRAAKTHDLPGLLFDLLRRAGAATSLAGLSTRENVDAAVLEMKNLDFSEAAISAACAAALGRDPSLRFRPLDLGGALPGAEVRPAKAPRRAVVAIHGRGSTAESVLAEARAIIGDLPDVWLLAPQADGTAWYPLGYAEPIESQQAFVEASLAAVSRAVDHAAAVVGHENVALFGFSQGACLATEWVFRAARPVAGLVALSGAALGGAEHYSAPASDLSGMPVLLGISSGDRWVRADDVRRTGDKLSAGGASVEIQVADSQSHTIRSLERIAARRILTGLEPAAPPIGFGNGHHAETLEGALPVGQNSPRHAPYGLYPEQINGSGFVAHRHQNLRAWMYRIRPSAQHTPLQRLEHPTLVSEFSGPAEPNLAGWSAPELPAGPTDFVDGLITLGGAGSAAMRRGWAAHFYVANQSMDGRAFYNADGDMLIIPQHGRITLQTDMGVLELPPGHVGIIPRGIRFSVLLPDGPARGYVGEVFGRHFELPERGPIGANGLTDARHFEAPTAWHEDRLHPGYRLTARYGGELFEAQQDYSPYDVVAWHGNYTPYRYDLLSFSPVGNTRFDHPDPSIFTVLTAPLDELGSHSLDFVFFPPRWDVSEHTFRPPYFHRNVTTEFNGIIQDPSLSPDGPFEPGGAFLTPSMTAHGVVARSVERNLHAPAERADAPFRVGQRSMWFQFESALPLVLTEWGHNGPARQDDWPDIWGAYKTHFTPGDITGPFGE